MDLLYKLEIREKQSAQKLISQKINLWQNWSHWYIKITVVFLILAITLQMWELEERFWCWWTALVLSIFWKWYLMAILIASSGGDVHNFQAEASLLRLYVRKIWLFYFNHFEDMWKHHFHLVHFSKIFLMLEGSGKICKADIPPANI